MNHLIASVAKRPPDFIIGDKKNPYLRRWWLTERAPEGYKVYLHHILRDDDDRALHDHPADSTSIIIEGGYMEHLPGDQVAHRYAGAVISRKADQAHRLRLYRDADGKAIPCWTLFIFGPKVREWGFHCPQGWVHWREYLDIVGEADGSEVGKGCG